MWLHAIMHPHAPEPPRVDAHGSRRYHCRRAIQSAMNTMNTSLAIGIDPQFDDSACVGLRSEGLTTRGSGTSMLSRDRPTTMPQRW